MRPQGYVQSFFIKVLILLGWLAVFCLSGPVAAASGEEPATEELAFIEIEDVFAAAKHQQSIREAPASITIVTDEQIKRYGYRDLTDVVNSVRSFYTYSDRNYEYIGVRGFARLGDYGNRVLQLIDGHTNNDSIYGSFFLGQMFGVDMDLVKKIEFIRGPGSTLYGSNALLGTVNVITKDGRDVGGLSTSVEGGSRDTYSGRLTYGHLYENGLDLLLSASFFNSYGAELYYPEFAASPSNGWARDADGERARKFLMKATFHEFTLLANLVWREKNVATGSYETLFDDNRSRTIDQRAFAEIKWDHPLDAESGLKARAYYDSYRFEGYYPYDYPPVTINRDEVSGRWIGSELSYDRAFSNHHFLVGGEIVRHLEARQQNYDESPRFVFLDDDRSFTNGSLYGQDEWDITSWLRFSGGVRYDRYSTFGNHFSPRAGFILRPAPDSTVKLLYGQAFRAPNVYELYYKTTTGTTVYRDNPALKPETIDTYELVLEQNLTPAAKLTVSGFRYEIKDLITQQVNPDASLQFFNISRVRSDGVEVGLEVNWPGFLKGNASYSYQDTRDDLTGQWLANSPRHLLKVGARIPLYREMIFAGAQFRYMGMRLDRDGNDVGGAAVTDLQLTAEYRNFSLSAGAYNLFDTVYADPVSADHTQRTIQQNGRNYRLKLGYTF
ncbi:MAG: TonB-dependent receptor [Deltaproteobacteria bacterium]|nr:TonB-dependent receptor [Deltaproteobacteria bacterium]